jgi:hypothetical protein
MMNIGLNSFVNIITEKKWLVVKIDFYEHILKGTRYKVQGTSEP